MLPVLQPVQQQQKPLVFPVALVDVPGEGPEQGHDHKPIGQKGQGQPQNLEGCENADERNKNPRSQQAGRQFVGSVTPRHKISDPRLPFFPEAHGPTLLFLDAPIISPFLQIATGWAHCLRKVKFSQKWLPSGGFRCIIGTLNKKMEGDSYVSGND